MRTIFHSEGHVKLIDQTRMPAEVVVEEYDSAEGMVEAIKSMRVRGAPGLGVAAAYAMALGARAYPGSDADGFLAHMRRVADMLRQTRPTAVNLSVGIRQAMAVVEQAPLWGVDVVKDRLLSLAEHLADHDVEVNRRMGVLGAELVPVGARVLTHCNTGSLATVEFGTALGVVRAAWEEGKRLHVWVCETRPLLQGARLTAWELQQAGIPFTLITDSMAGYFMSLREVDLVLVGADRIAANGDVANKVGTYSLAVLAHVHQVPFYVVAPTSSVDLGTAKGTAIPIEERKQEEVLFVGNQRIAPAGTHAANPAFDITPAKYVGAIVTEAGIVRPPFEQGLAAAVRASQSDSYAGGSLVD